MVYLDATVYLFNNDKKYIELVDYSEQNDSSGAVIHSGDVIDHTKKSGKHTIEIDLKRLPKDITILYFSISTCCTILKEIKQPYIRLTDADSGMELCRYNLEQKNLGQQTAAVMCKMYKSNDCWNVVALGELGPGRCTERYRSIVKTIQDKLLK